MLRRGAWIWQQLLLLPLPTIHLLPHRPSTQFQCTPPSHHPEQPSCWLVGALTGQCPPSMSCQHRGLSARAMWSTPAVMCLTTLAQELLLGGQADPRHCLDRIGLQVTTEGLTLQSYLSFPGSKFTEQDLLLSIRACKCAVTSHSIHNKQLP